MSSNHDKELGNIFPNLFQNFIADTPIQEPSSLSLGYYLNAPISNKCNDEEEEVKICEDLLFTQNSSSSYFSREMIKKDVNAMIDACYESAGQKSNTDLFSFGISYKDIIIEEEIVSCDNSSYRPDEFRLCEWEHNDLDHLLSLHCY